MMECASFRTASFRERRALSAPDPFWQSPLWLSAGRRALPAALLAALAAAPALAVPGGDLGTLTQGRYACEVPDPLGVTRGTPEENASFSIVNASSYRDEHIVGSYLRTGDSVVLTSGVRAGERYRVVSTATLQRVDAKGTDTPVRCVLVKRNTK